MKIFKSQYFFYILLSTLLVALAVFSLTYKPNKTNAETMNASATITAAAGSNFPWVDDVPYFSQTIYAANPYLEVAAGTNPHGAISGSRWVTVKADGNNLQEEDSITATQYNSQEKGWVIFSLNETYYNASVYVEGKNGSNSKGNETISSTGEHTYTWENAIAYYATMTVTGKSVNYYFYDSNYNVLKSGSDQYGKEVSCTSYGEPTGKHWVGWKVGEGSTCDSSTVRLYAYQNGSKLEAYFYGVYDWNKYKVHFDANGGSGTSTKTCTYGETHTIPSSGPTRPGYRLVRWNTRADGTGKDYNFNESYSNLTTANNGNFYLYAQWEEISYNISFNSNSGVGGKYSSVVKYNDYGYTNSTYPIKSNRYINPRTGLCFYEWKLNYASTVNFRLGVGLDSSGNLMSASDYYTNPEFIVFNNYTGGNIMLTSNYTVYGIYAYDFNGMFIKRCSNYATTHYIPNETYFIRIEMNVKDLAFKNLKNLQVLGTLRNAEMNEIRNFVEETTFKSGIGLGVKGEEEKGFSNLGKNTSKYIPFFPNTKKVLTSNNPLSDLCAYDSKKNFIARPQVKDNRYLIPEGTYYIRFSVSYNNLENLKFGHFLNLTTIPNKEVQLFTSWIKEHYELIYNGLTEQAISSIRSDEIVYNGEYTLPIPKRAGYEFTGWQLQQNSDGTVDLLNPVYKDKTPTYPITNSEQLQNGITIKIPDWGNDGMKDDIISVPLLAQWVAITYTVNFDANGGTGTMSAIEKIFDNNSNLPENTFIKTGYNFAGWSTSPQEDDHSVNDAWIDIYKPSSWFRGDSNINGNGNNTGEYYITNTEPLIGNSVPDIDSSELEDINQAKYYQGNDIYFVTGEITKYNPIYFSQPTNFPLGVTKFNNIMSSQGNSITLYAVWEAVDYEIVFDGNNATSGEMENQARIYNVEGNLPQNNYKRNGHLFLGWSLNKISANEGTPENATYKNIVRVRNIAYDIKEFDEITLYAVWKETWAVYNQIPQGEGSKNSPYLIESAENLAWISWKLEKEEGFGNKVTPYFKQTANIDLSAHEWLPIGNQSNIFTGNYDGNGYIIKNLQTFRITNVIRENIGLFGYASKSQLSSSKNLINNVRVFGLIEGNDNIGGILGNGNNVIIENCTNNCTISATTTTGGIAGQIQNAEIISCYNYGDISSSTSDGVAGGIVGQGISSKILNCYSNCLVNGFYSGGIAGKMINGEISSSALEGEVRGENSYGFIGNSENTKISNCFAKANILGEENYGLFFGSSTIENCIFEINGIKRCLGNDFSAWVISSDGRPLPSGLSWLAIGGTKVTNISQITVNYTKVG